MALRPQPDQSAGGGGTWGSITGTLADQTDLSTALAGKVAESDVHVFGPFSLSLLGTGEADRIAFCPGFSGTLTRIRSVLYGDNGLDDTVTMTTSIDGVACTGGAVTHAGAASEGDKQTSAINAGGAFTAAQIVKVLVSGTNITYAWAGVTLEYTRS